MFSFLILLKDTRKKTSTTTSLLLLQFSANENNFYVQSNTTVCEWNNVYNKTASSSANYQLPLYLI